MTNVSLPKLKAILLYFGNHTKYLGKIKLMKLFYFLDFMHVKYYGAPVTYDTYINLEKGPIPSTILNLINESVDEEKKSAIVDVVHFETPKGTRMVKMIPNRKFTDADRKYFSETEFKMLQKVCALFGNSSMNEIKEASHKEAPWRKTKYLDEIPYSLATEDPDSKISKEEIELLLKAI